MVSDPVISHRKFETGFLLELSVFIGRNICREDSKEAFGRGIKPYRP